MTMDGNRSKLSYNKQELESILNSIDMGIHIVDKEGCTLFYNKTAEKIDGIRQEDIIGKNMKDLVKQGVFSRSIALTVIETQKDVTMSQRVNGRLILSKGVSIFEGEELSKVIVLGRDMFHIEQLRDQLQELRTENNEMLERLSNLNVKHLKEDQLISKSKAMNSVVQLSKRISKVDSTVLIEGDSGVGKGRIAKFIHENSLRRDKPFVKVDCSSIHENLFESELFGYEEGSFTGAIKGGKKGLILSANGGTLFLDEIGELPLSMQVKLLATIQEKNVQPVGSIKKTAVDVRIIAATNKNIYGMVQEGKFREDLYYRLRVIPINIPPLRERGEDIVPLINVCVNKFNSYYNLNKVISPRAMKILLKYDWPGNVRELENTIERLIVTVEDNIIQEKDILDLELKIDNMHIKENLSLKEQVQLYERDLIIDYMQKTKSVKELSKIANIDESTLRKKAKRLNIDLNF